MPDSNRSADEELMKRKIAIAGLLGAALAVAVAATHYAPGSRVVVLAHNAYPDHGQYVDRLDRVIATGRPFVVEQDLAWIDGKSLMIHGAKNAATIPLSSRISSRGSGR
jgi:hypothetical protein